MSSRTDFFVTPEVNSQLREIAVGIQTNTLINAGHLGMLHSVFVSMVESNADWDHLCQFTIKQYGGQFKTALTEVRKGNNAGSSDTLKAISYSFLVESDLSTESPVTEEFIQIRRQIEVDLKDRDDIAGAIVKFGMERLATRILKSVFNSSELVKFKGVADTARDVELRIASWKQEVSSREEQAMRLKDTLDKYSNAFNFVGLYQGFSSLEESTTKELDKQRRNLKGFGLLMLAPAVLDFALILSDKIHYDANKPTIFIAAAVASITLTLLFMYFFRIVLRDVDSKEAQLMQIRLRMTLCQFIQNYAEYASEIKSKNTDVLAKFENLIFSGIVGTQDKLPSTFDGIEQLSSLIKNARGK